jgi:hypothetical protein
MFRNADYFAGKLRAAGGLRSACGMVVNAAGTKFGFRVDINFPLP